MGDAGLEHLEHRALMAADLVLSFNDNVAANVERLWYAPASQIVYSLTVENKGDATATNVNVSTSLATGVTARTWTAAYSGGGTGDKVGAGNVGVPITLPAGAKATFTIFGTVGGSVTGDLVSTATVDAAPGEGNTVDNAATDTDRYVPGAVVVSGDVGNGNAALVRLVDPGTGREIARATAFQADVQTGVRTSFADLDGDGKKEIVAVTNYGQAGRLAVFRQVVTGGGANPTVTLQRDTRYDLLPFGPAYDRGLNVVAADFNADGQADVAVSKAFGDGAVKVYTSTPSAPAGPLTLFTTFTPFPGAVGGAALAAGDFGTFSGAAVVDSLKQDSKAELVVASGTDARPLVKIVNVSQATPVVLDSFQPFTAGFRGGLNVAVALVNADSTPDVIVSQGRGGSSEVEIYDGTVGSAASRRLARFAAFADVAARGAAVFASGIDSSGDGHADSILVTQGGAGRSAMRKYSTAGVLQGSVAGLADPLRLAVATAAGDPRTITTSTGLQYQQLVAGTGSSPTSTSTVNVDYAGFLLSNGTKFDSGNGVSFAVSGVVSGFAEALKRMKPGEVVKVIIPSKLGYGAAGSPPKVPGNADLVFMIKLNSFTG